MCTSIVPLSYCQCYFEASFFYFVLSLRPVEVDYLLATLAAEAVEERVDVVTAAVRRQWPRGRVLLGQQSPPVEERIDEVVATGLRRRRASRRCGGRRGGRTRASPLGRARRRRRRASRRGLDRDRVRVRKRRHRPRRPAAPPRVHGGRRVGRHRDNEVRRVDDEARVVAGAAERRRPADRDDGARADLAARLRRGARRELRDHRRARVVAEDEDGVGGVVFAAQRLLDARDDPWQLLALDEFRQRVGRRRSGVVPERLERDAPGPRGGFGRHACKPLRSSVRARGTYGTISTISPALLLLPGLSHCV